MADPVFKKIQLVGTSGESFSDAAAKAIAKASESLRNMSWFEVAEQRRAFARRKVAEMEPDRQVVLLLESPQHAVRIVGRAF